MRMAMDISTETDQVADAVRMARCVGDGHGRSLRHPEQGHSVHPGGIDDRREVTDPSVEIQRPRIAVRQPAAAVVVANDGEALPKLGQPWTPDEALPVMLEVRHPRADPHQRRTAAVLGPGDPHPVGTGREPGHSAKERS